MTVVSGAPRPKPAGGRSVEPLMDDSQVAGWIVIAGSGHVIHRAFGTQGGHMFRTIEAAERAKHRLERDLPRFDWITVPVQQHYYGNGR